MADGNEAGGFSPLWYSVGALILIVVMMGIIVTLKPLEFKPVVAAHCEDGACGHEAAPAAGEPEGVSHAHEAAPPPAHPE